MHLMYRRSGTLQFPHSMTSFSFHHGICTFAHRQFLPGVVLGVIMCMSPLPQYRNAQVRFLAAIR